jgi:hypothetical protein
VFRIPPCAGARQRQPIGRAFDRREVADHHGFGRAGLAAADPGIDRDVGGIGLDPLKAPGLGVALMQRRRRAIQPVEIADQPLHAGMAGIVQRAPVKRRAMVPFARLGEFLAHEQKLLARMAPHEP